MNVLTESEQVRRPAFLPSQSRTRVAVVTWDDIDDNNHSCTACPVALAIERAAECPVVCGRKKFILYPFEYGRYEYELPERAARFIRAYDDRRQGWLSKLRRWFYVRPFVFQIEVEAAQ